MKVTTESLQGVGACSDQVELFSRLWPNGVTVTKAALLKAQREGLDIEWWAHHALPAPARQVYNKVFAPAWKAYNEAVAPPRKVYDARG